MGNYAQAMSGLDNALVESDPQAAEFYVKVAQVRATLAMVEVLASIDSELKMLVMMQLKKDEVDS